MIENNLIHRNRSEISMMPIYIQGPYIISQISLSLPFTIPPNVWVVS
jgi:hypothetical protein